MTFPLFDLFSLFYTFISLRTLWQLKEQWQSFTDDRLTGADRKLASNVAFFLMIPVGVFLHELGHAVATWQVGGQVVDFQWRVFWGYIVPAGRFTLLQDWWIAFSGNLVSFLYGIAFLPLLRLRLRPILKYLALTFARYQLIYTLVWYPLLTLSGFEGDWRTIYSTHTLWLSAPLLAIHVALVAGLWWINRSPWLKRWAVTLNDGASEELAVREAEVQAQPASADARVNLGNFYLQQQEPDLAIQEFRRALDLDSANARAHLSLAQVYVMQKRQHKATDHFRQALVHLPANSPHRAWAHQGLAQDYLERGQPAQAEAELSHALAVQPGAPELYYWRGVARRAQGHTLEAEQDFQRAADLAGAGSPIGEMARQQLQ
ncbi:MAG: hypothetical protein A2Z04_05285 [Chloroflexi bacterium RBG_16_57_9]|nr:MAG: hypothetical protein A2Z04_05285 [Chloroflexi bacterium RBG_16_57_9]